jgi:hypothetical protein
MAVGPTIQIRRDTAANWASANPTLAAGESGFDTTNQRFKIGDGSTAWSSLAYQGAAVDAIDCGRPDSVYGAVLTFNCGGP